MGYGEFTFASALKKFRIQWIIRDKDPEAYQRLSLEFNQKEAVILTETLRSDLEFGFGEYRTTAIHSEAALNTYFIWPFLKEVCKQHRKLRIWQGITFEVDWEQNLTGHPDYFVTKMADLPQAPCCIIVEAKKEDFEKGWGQSLAAMRAAQIFNQKEASLSIPIYGIVSSGVLWQFGKLEQDQFINFPETLFINILEAGNPEKVLSLVDTIFSACEQRL